MAALAKVGGVIALGVLGCFGIRCTQCMDFNDVPGPSKNDFGRTVNSLSALIAGIVAQQIKPNSEFVMTIEKPMWADATVKGKVTPTSIDAYVDLALTSARFKSEGDIGKQKGEVQKSEFNWNVSQSAPEKWHVGRFALKLDTDLVVKAQNGIITGRYEKPLAFDWTISGRYDQEGHVSIEISTGPTQPNFKIVGTVTAK